MFKKIRGGIANNGFSNGHSAEFLKQLTEISQKSSEEVIKEFGSSKHGLTDDEAELRLSQHGKNEVDYEKVSAWWIQLAKAFINPFNLILVVLAVTSYTTDVVLAAPGQRDYTKMIILGLMVSISGLLRFWQEFRSQKAVEKIKKLVQTKASVLRRRDEKITEFGKFSGASKEIPTTEIVKGDVIILSAGDIVPADIRLIYTDDLFLSQSTLTGESMSVEKYAALNSHSEKIEDIFDIKTLCFMGTTVTSGYGKGIVVGVGRNTYFGSMAKQITAKRPLTNFDKGINGVSWVLITFMLVMVPVVLIINGLTKGNWHEAFFFALAVAVGLTPEMLPLVVTSNLARGSIRMAKKKVIVKNLNSIQNFGAMDILCSDKTGTITENRIVLIRHLDAEGNHSDTVLKLAYLNSYFQTGLKNLMDQTILEHDEKALATNELLEYKKIDEIPFDFTRRRMSIVLERKKSSRKLICKGAVEEILNHSTKVNIKGKIVKLKAREQDSIVRIKTSLNEEGLRVIAVAYKELPPNDKRKQYPISEENGLIFAGYIAFLDPPKESAKEAMKLLHESGVSVKVITGDNEVITRKICREVNLHVNKTLSGPEIEKMSEEELIKAAEHTTIFTKIDPLQKARIIAAIKKNDHVVGFLGDGVNDAAALKEADVGISVNTGVDIAKESASIILLEHDLLVLKAGVDEGRTVFGNIIKYIKMTASSNFGNVFSILVASAFLPFLPMLALQLLVQNLLYDTSQLSIPWDNMDKDYISKPRKWDASNLVRFIISIGPVSSIFDISTFMVMWYIFGANTIAHQSLFQSGWFIEGLLSQILIVHMIRTERIPFVESRASAPVLLMTAVIMMIGIAIPFSLFGHVIGLQPLPLIYFVWLVGILFGYYILAQLVKKWYISRFNAWL